MPCWERRNGLESTTGSLWVLLKFESYYLGHLTPPRCERPQTGDLAWVLLCSFAQHALVLL